MQWSRPVRPGGESHVGLLRPRPGGALGDGCDDVVDARRATAQPREQQRAHVGHGGAHRVALLAEHVPQRGRAGGPGRLVQAALLQDLRQLRAQGADDLIDRLGPFGAGLEVDDQSARVDARVAAGRSQPDHAREPEDIRICADDRRHFFGLVLVE